MCSNRIFVFALSFAGISALKVLNCGLEVANQGQSIVKASEMSAVLNKTPTTCTVINPTLYLSDDYVFQSGGITGNLSRFDSLQMSGINMNVIPINIGSQLTSLTSAFFTGCQANILYKETFASLGNLTTLNITFCNVISIEIGAFRGLSKVEVLSLRGNLMTTLSVNIFLPLASLKEVSLQANRNYRIINEDLFLSSKNLEVVDVSECNIYYVKPNLFETNEKLKRVDFMDNSCINSRYNTTNFDEMKAKLKKTCPLAASQVNRQVLCDVQESPDTCVVEQQLVDGPNYTFTVPSASNKYNIENVRFSGINIDQIPFWMGREFVRLVVIECFQCDVETIFKGNFEGLKTVTEISITYSNVSVIEFDAFFGAPKIKKLDFSGNKIRSLEGNLFDPLGCLREFTMVENTGMQMMREDIFKNNSKLEDVDFSECGLANITARLFERNKKLRKVDFQRNKCIDKTYHDNFDAMRTAINRSCPVRELLLATRGGPIMCSVNRTVLGFASGRKYRACAIKHEKLEFNSTIAAPPGTNGSIEIIFVMGQTLAQGIPQNLTKLLPDVEIVRFYMCNIKSIYSGNFNYTNKFIKLMVTHANVKTLERGAFDGLSLLEELDLSSNYIDGILENIFAPLVSLRGIDLSNNRLTTVHSRAFDPLLKKLQYANLYQNSPCINNIYQNGTYDKMKIQLEKSC